MSMTDMDGDTRDSRYQKKKYNNKMGNKMMVGRGNKWREMRQQKSVTCRVDRGDTESRDIGVIFVVCSKELCICEIEREG